MKLHYRSHSIYSRHAGLLSRIPGTKAQTCLGRFWPWPSHVTPLSVQRLLCPFPGRRADSPRRQCPRNGPARSGLLAPSLVCWLPFSRPDESSAMGFLFRFSLVPQALILQGSPPRTQRSAAQIFRSLPSPILGISGLHHGGTPPCLFTSSIVPYKAEGRTSALPAIDTLGAGCPLQRCSLHRFSI